MGAQRLQVGRLDIFWPGGQEVCVAEDCLLLRGEDTGPGLAARFFQCGDLLVRQPVPLTRNGMRLSSKSATAQDRRPEVGKVLELRGECAIGPDRGVELIEGPQHIRFMCQHPEVRSDSA